jgi:signal transduction histidine kinase
MPARAMTLVVLIGVAVAATLATAVGTDVHDTVALVAIAAAGSIASSAIGALALRRLRRRPVRIQALVVALSSVVAMAVGVLLAAHEMFIDGHDLRTLFVVIVVSGAVAIGAALQLGRDVERRTARAGELARGLLDEPLRLPPQDGTNELIRVVAELHSVSQQLDESRARERALDTSRRELVTWVSHDLRSPLATVRAMAEALDDGVVDDEETVRRYHGQLRRDAERLTKLVDDLFELSRISSDPALARSASASASLTDVVAGVSACASSLAEVKGVTIVEDLPVLPDEQVPARELERALHNLFDNAVRHTPPGGTVLFAAEVADSNVVLSVHDECGGIPESDLDRVFDVAFRGDVARSRDDRGGGLGLAIAKGLVEAQSGTIDVTNVDEGCCFSVRLPLHATE